MRKVVVGLIMVGSLFACTFPEEYKSTTQEIVLDENQAKVLTMSEEEFVQKAKQDDPAFRKSLDELNQRAMESEQIRKDQDDRDRDLKMLVESETSKKASQPQILEEEVLDETTTE